MKDKTKEVGYFLSGTGDDIDLIKNQDENPKIEEKDKELHFLDSLLIFDDSKYSKVFASTKIIGHVAKQD